MNTPNTQNYRFAFRCSYQGSTWFEVIGDGNSYQIELRHSLHGYERRGWNGNDARWLTEIVPTLHSIRRDNRPDIAIPDPVVDAFNTWRIVDHTRNLQLLLDNPHRYGVVAADDPIRRQPSTVRALQLRSGPGNGHIGIWNITRPWPDQDPSAAFYLREGRPDFGGRGPWTFELADGSANGWDLKSKEAAEAAARAAMDGAGTSVAA
jgi:hypothetical protein